MAHSRLEALLLAVLVSCLFPFSLGCLIVNYTILSLVPRKNLRKRFRRTPGFRPRKILITGVSTPYGLRLARAFYETGHDVVGVDHRDSYLPLHPRWSISLLKFHILKTQTDGPTKNSLARDLLSLIQVEFADLWIDCSSSTSSPNFREASRLIEQKTSCVCFADPQQATNSFSRPRAFLEFVLRCGLPIPESHHVKSRDQIHNVLNQSRGNKRYVLHETDSSPPINRRTLLPRRTLSQTYNEVAKIKIRDDAQWVLERSLEGLQRYKTFSILANGHVQVFSVCYETENGSLQLLQPSPMHGALMRYVVGIAQHLGQDANCHMCVDFCVDEKLTDTGVEQRILPVDGRLTADTSGLSFQGMNGSVDLVRAYLSTLSHQINGSVDSTTTLVENFEDRVQKPSAESQGIYSIGYDLFRLLQVIWGLIKFQAQPTSARSSGIRALHTYRSMARMCLRIQRPSPSLVPVPDLPPTRAVSRPLRRQPAKNGATTRYDAHDNMR